MTDYSSDQIVEYVVKVFGGAIQNRDEKNLVALLKEKRDEVEVSDVSIGFMSVLGALLNVDKTSFVWVCQVLYRHKLEAVIKSFFCDYLE